MTRARKQDAAALLRRALAALDTPTPANDDEPVIDEQALRDRMHAIAEKLRRARNR